MTDNTYKYLRAQRERNNRIPQTQNMFIERPEYEGLTPFLASDDQETSTPMVTMAMDNYRQMLKQAIPSGPDTEDVKIQRATSELQSARQKALAKKFDDAFITGGDPIRASAAGGVLR